MSKKKVGIIDISWISKLRGQNVVAPVTPQLKNHHCAGIPTGSNQGQAMGFLRERRQNRQLLKAIPVLATTGLARDNFRPSSPARRGAMIEPVRNCILKP